MGTWQQIAREQIAYRLMSVLKLTLKQLEARLEALIEGSTARLLPGGRAPRDLVQRLLAAMQTGSLPGPDGALQAPDVFFLLCHPSQANHLQGNQVFLEELAHLLEEAGRQAGLFLSGTPLVRVEVDPSLGVGDIQVAAHNSLQDHSLTSGMVVDQNNSRQVMPANAFLIVDGLRVFVLNQAVVNIGRRPDNHLVIDDRRVSRLHVQLRFVQDRFIIFDLDSSGGTWINGQRIRQQTLAPGDVISLAGVPLIFGLEAPSLGDTQEISVNRGQGG